MKFWLWLWKHLIVLCKFLLLLSKSTKVLALALTAYLKFYYDLQLWLINETLDALSSLLAWPDLTRGIAEDMNSIFAAYDSLHLWRISNFLRHKCEISCWIDPNKVSNSESNPIRHSCVQMRQLNVKWSIFIRMSLSLNSVVVYICKEVDHIRL